MDNVKETKRTRYNQTDASKYADEFLNMIYNCITERLKSQPRLVSAVVSSVNEDGTINVCFPPNNDKIFTRIQNQSVYDLSEGDSVEMVLKDGTFNNCWVLAKHQSDKIRRIQLQEARINYSSGGGSGSGGGGGVVGGVVRYDTEQILTNPQKLQARVNIGAGTSNFSGSYNDLTDTPTIPTVPTQVSAFENDAGYVNTDSMNSAIAAADQALKQEIINLLTGYYSEDNPPPYPVTSVDGESGAVETNAVKVTAQTLTEEQKAQARSNIGAGDSSFSGDYNDLTNLPTIPTTVAELTDGGEYAKLASPQFTGTPTTPTVDIATNDTTVANTEFVQSLVANVTGGSISGPDSSVDGNIVAFNGTTGRLVKDSGVTASRINALTAAVLSVDEPEGQQVGDLWFREIT